MKIKVLTRNPDDYLRETKHDIHKMPRNFAPEAHPMSESREYVRALNATKLDRVFAKPFVANLEGHTDGVHCLTTHPSQLTTVVSGSYDGELRLWNLSDRSCISHVHAHEGWVRGVSVFPHRQPHLAPIASSSSSPTSHHVCVSVGDDQMIKLWQLPDDLHNANNVNVWTSPVHTLAGKTNLLGVSTSWAEGGTTFATCGEQVDVWDALRSTPVRSFTWGTDSTHCIAYAPIETSVMAALASDRSTILYDNRTDVPLRRVVMKLRCNKIAWNPMEAFVFTVASDDYNCYTFDMRQLKAPVNVHCDHTEAVTDLCYSPTGKEFVTGSYDRSVRIFDVGKGRSREVYHTKRMHRVMCVAWTLDNSYVLSGSAEMNLRLWKANASEKLGVMRAREARSAAYSTALREKYAAMPQVQRIARHRQVPKHIFNAHKEHTAIRQSRKRKEANRRAHSRVGSVPFEGERTTHVVGEEA